MANELDYGNVNLLVLDSEEGAKKFLSGISGFGYFTKVVTDTKSVIDEINNEKYLALVVNYTFYKNTLNNGDDLDLFPISKSSFDIPPAFFYSEDNKLETHLEILKLGGEVFFATPIDFKVFSKKLGYLSGSYHIELENLLYVSDFSINDCKADLIVEDYADDSIDKIQFCGSNEVLDRISSRLPSVLIVDMKLNGCSGLDLAAVIRQNISGANGMPILFLCEEDGFMSELSSANLSINKFLIKPASLARIVSASRRLLFRSRASKDYSPSLQRRDLASGLYDREYFLAELEKTFVEFDRAKADTSLIFLKIKKFDEIFKKFKESHMHDYIIQELLKKIEQNIHDGDLFVRYSDRVFCIISYNKELSALKKYLKLLIAKISAASISVGDDNVSVKFAVGVSFFTKKEEKYLDILSNADIAATAAEESEGNSVKFYQSQSESRKNILRQKRWQKKIADGKFRIVYQPIVGLHENDKRQYEVLFRMRRRETLPEQFLSIAEKMGVIERIDIEMTRRAMDIARRKYQDKKPVELMVNISRKSVVNGKFSEWLISRVKSINLPEKLITFAINEDDVVSSYDKFRSFAETIKAAGQLLMIKQSSVDNCSSTMKVVSDLSANYIRLDRLFIHKLSDDGGCQIQLKNLVKHGEQNGYQIIGAYVDDPNTLAALWQEKVHFVQGYFIQRPVNAMSFHESENMSPFAGF